jgi:hypothetical protein
LALGLEPRHDLLGVHAQLDDLERDTAPHWLLLFRHPDRAEGSLADWLEEFVTTDVIAGLLD